MPRHTHRARTGSYTAIGHPLGYGHSGGRRQHPDGRKFGGGQKHPEGPDDAIASSGFGGTQPHPTDVNDAANAFGGAQGAPTTGAGGGDGEAAPAGGGGMALGGLM